MQQMGKEYNTTSIMDEHIYLIITKGIHTITEKKI